MKLFKAKRQIESSELPQLIQEDLAALEQDPEYLAIEVLLDINEQICVRMDSKGINRNSLAKKLGWSRSAVSKMLNGNPNMSIKRLCEIAVALGVRILPPRLVDKEHHAFAFPGLELKVNVADGGMRLEGIRGRSDVGAQEFIEIPSTENAA